MLKDSELRFLKEQLDIVQGHISKKFVSSVIFNSKLKIFLVNIKAIFAMLFILMELLINKSVSLKESVLFYDNSESHFLLRSKYIKYYTGKDSIGFHPGLKIGLRGTVGIRKNILKIWVDFFVFICLGLFSNSFVSKYDYMLTCRILLKLTILIETNKIDKIYTFFSYFLPAYLATTRIHKKYGCNISYIMSNAPISSPLTSEHFHTFFNYTNIISCSKFQTQEAKYMKKKKLFNFDTLEERGNENIEVTKKYKNIQVPISSKYEYDIGIFTQGYWARGSDNMRISNVSQINNLKPNAYSLQEKEMVSTVLENFSDKRIILLPHPHETYLIKKYGFEPYYIKYQEKYPNLVIDLKNKDGSLNLERAFIGLTLYSSIGIERLDFGFRNIFYVGSNTKYFKYFSHTEFKDSFAENKKDLISAVGKLF